MVTVRLTSFSLGPNAHSLFNMGKITDGSIHLNITGQFLRLYHIAMISHLCGPEASPFC